MSSLIFLNSRDSTSYSEENHEASWVINLPRLNNMMGFQLSLQNVEVPNVVYPINAYYNTVYWHEVSGADSLSAALTANNYTGTQLATALATAMTTESAANGSTRTYSGSYDSQSKKLTLTVAGDTFYWEAGSDTDPYCYDEMGLQRSLMPKAAAASQVSDFPINVSGTQFVDVVTNFSNHNFSTGTTGNILARVPMDLGFGNVVTKTLVDKEKLFISVSHIDEIRISLRDDRGNPWILPANAHISLTLRVDPIEHSGGYSMGANNVGHHHAAYSNFGDEGPNYTY